MRLDFQDVCDRPKWTYCKIAMKAKGIMQEFLNLPPYEFTRIHLEALLKMLFTPKHTLARVKMQVFSATTGDAMVPRGPCLHSRDQLRKFGWAGCSALVWLVCLFASG